MLRCQRQMVREKPDVSILAENDHPADPGDHQEPFESFFDDEEINNIQQQYICDAWRQEAEQRFRTLPEVQSAIRRITPNCSTNLNKDEALQLLEKLLFKQRKDGGFALESFSHSGQRKKPETVRHYGESFNAVDRIDLMLSFVRIRDRNSSASVALLHYMIGLAVVQSHSLLSQDRWQAVTGDDIRQFYRDAKIGQHAEFFNSLEMSITKHHKALLQELREHEQTLTAASDSRIGLRRSSSGGLPPAKRIAFGPDEL